MYRIYPKKRHGNYLKIFHNSSAALTQRRHLFEGGIYLKVGSDKERY